MTSTAVLVGAPYANSTLTSWISGQISPAGPILMRFCRKVAVVPGGGALPDALLALWRP